jgi:tetratricopeptide (TPR) repeat protein
VNFRFLTLSAVPAAAFLFVALLASGCGSDPRDNTAGGRTPQQAAETVNELDVAMTAVGTMFTSKDSENQGRALFNLNQWIIEAEGPERFDKDPLLDRIPRAYDKTEPLQSLHRRNFDSADLLYLQQCLWLRDIALRVAPRPAPANLESWLKYLEKQLGISQAEQVRSAERLFDWTICNLQLDKLPPPPKAAAAGVGKTDRTSQPGPMRGEKGPGYWQLPWQALLFGHGDAWQRSRVFLLMCRQTGIRAYMLGVQDAGGSGAVRPWLCGVLVKGQFYLFDAELGLPILAPDGQGIATLDQVVADPGLIRAMDIPGEAPYRVTDAELQGIQVLIDAEPQALSLRMKMLESALIGDKRVILTCRPSDEEKELPKFKYISGVSIWRVCLEAVLFHVEMDKLRRQNPGLQVAYFRQTYMFFPPNGLGEARHLQFEGQFNAKPEDDKKGACQVFSQLRMPYSALDSLDTSTEARRMLGMREEILSKDPNIRSGQIKDMASIAKMNKNHATYWIGLCHFDAGNYKVAEEWFRDRTLAESQDSPWLPGARYNLARCYEALGKWNEARELYLNDESPQKIGNLLRAQRIAGKK